MTTHPVVPHPLGREDGRAEGETPETDAILIRWPTSCPLTEDEWSAVADALKRLERERNAAREAYAALIDVHRGWCNYCQGNEGICLSSPAGGCSIADHLLDRDGEGGMSALSPFERFKIAAIGRISHVKRSRCWLWHSWNPWKDTSINVVYGFPRTDFPIRREQVQHRRCEHCNKLETRKTEI